MFSVGNTPLFTGIKCLIQYVDILDPNYAVVYWLEMSQYVNVLDPNYAIQMFNPKSYAVLATLNLTPGCQ